MPALVAAEKSTRASSGIPVRNRQTNSRQNIKANQATTRFGDQLPEASSTRQYSHRITNIPQRQASPNHRGGSFSSSRFSRPCCHNRKMQQAASKKAGYESQSSP